MTRPRVSVLCAALVSLLGLIFAQPALPDTALVASSLADEVLPDKALHAVAGASVALLAAAITAACVTESNPGAAAGAVAAAGFGSAAFAGLAKEFLDLTGAGDPDLVDLLCTLLGGAAAAAASYELVRARAVSGDFARLTAPLASFGIILAVPVADAWFRAARRAGKTRKGGNSACSVLP